MKIVVIPFLALNLFCHAQTDSLNLAVENLRQIVESNHISQAGHYMYITIKSQSVLEIPLIIIRRHTTGHSNINCAIIISCTFLG